MENLNKKIIKKSLNEAKILAKTNQLDRVVPELGDDDIVKLVDEHEQGESPMYAEYLSDKKGEVPFVIGDNKYEYVWAKYPNKRDIGVYDFNQDLVYDINWFQKNILKFNENVNEISAEDAQYNPWAVCTSSTGREDKEKYEKCVKSVKKDQGVTEDNAFVKLGKLLGVDEGDSNWTPDENFSNDDNFGKDELFEDPRDMGTLENDVKKVISRLNMDSIQAYLNKIDKPIEQAEMVAQFAEKIGVPRNKLGVILKSLKNIAENVINTKPVIKKNDLVRLIKGDNAPNILKTVKIKDI